MAVKDVGQMYKVMWCIHSNIYPLSFLMTQGQVQSVSGDVTPVMEYLRRKYELAKASQD